MSLISNTRRLVVDRRKLEMMVAIAIFYATLSVAYSFLGFLHYQPGSHYHEYTLGKFVIEVIGHFVFGFVAGLALMDIYLALLTGSLAVLIDGDHLLSALNLQVSGRPDHSLFYILVSGAFIFYVGTKLRLEKRLVTKLVFVAPVVLLAHLSYDVFAASGTTFQILIPFSYQEYYFPYYTWLILEAAAVLISLFGLQFSKIYSRQEKQRQPTRSLA